MHLSRQAFKTFYKIYENNLLSGYDCIIISFTGRKLEHHSATKQIQSVNKRTRFPSYPDNDNIVLQRPKLQLDFRVHSADLECPHPLFKVSATEECDTRAVGEFRGGYFVWSVKSYALERGCFPKVVFVAIHHGIVEDSSKRTNFDVCVLECGNR